MLEASAMSRILKITNLRRVAKNIMAQRTSGPVVVGDQHVTQDALCWCRGFSCRGRGPVPATYHAQVAWKRLFQINSHNGLVFSHITKFAQAFCLASTRSHMVAPGIFALICGELALANEAWAHFPPKNTMVTRAEDGHAYVSSLLVSLLEGFVILVRALYLVILFLPTIASAPFVGSFGLQFRKKWIKLLHCTLERAGPAFIKWGQWAATRPDLFPRDLCCQLAELHSKAPQHSFLYTKQSIERAFGHDISDIFEDFDELPIASGSIAQVHRATLKSNRPRRWGRPTVVAVKVRHPGVSESIRRDFAIIKTAVKVSKFIPTLKWLRLDESIQQFAVFMMSQVDLSREAAHLTRFIYNFRKWKHVSFPKPLYPLVHPAVLVESFEHGESVSRYLDGVEGQNRIKTALAHIGTHALLKMVLVDNFIHADLHPGNIIVRVAQKNSPRKQLLKSKPHIVFIDVGMTTELSKGDRLNLLEFFKAVACRDGRTAAECTLRLSKQQSCPNAKGFIEEVEASFNFWGTVEGDLVHPADCMQHLLEQVRRHRVNIDGNVCTVIVTTLVLEGWQRKLDADYDMMHTLQRVLLKSDWAESLSYTIEGLMAP